MSKWFNVFHELSSKALFEITGPLGSKRSFRLCSGKPVLFHGLLPTTSATAEMMGFLSQIRVYNDWGHPHSHRQDRFTGLEKNSFKAIHIAPTKFSGQISVNKWLWSKQAPPSRFTHPASRKVRSRLQRPSLIQKERNYQTFQTLGGPKDLCSATFKWDLFKTADDNREQTSVDAVITLLHF